MLQLLTKLAATLLQHPCSDMMHWHKLKKSLKDKTTWEMWGIKYTEREKKQYNYNIVCLSVFNFNFIQHFPNRDLFSLSQYLDYDRKINANNNNKKTTANELLPKWKVTLGKLIIVKNKLEQLLVSPRLPLSVTQTFKTKSQRLWPTKKHLSSALRGSCLARNSHLCL